MILFIQQASQTKSVDVTKIIKDRNINETEMVEYAEDFFLSMGFEPLPDTFWERSLFVKPSGQISCLSCICLEL